MKNHMTTYVSLPKGAGQLELRRLAAERLGGVEGLKRETFTSTDDLICATFSRTWETSDLPRENPPYTEVPRVTHIDEAAEGEDR